MLRPIGKGRRVAAFGERQRHVKARPRRRAAIGGRGQVAVGVIGVGAGAEGAAGDTGEVFQAYLKRAIPWAFPELSAWRCPSLLHCGDCQQIGLGEKLWHK
jgi:hypothetical protein